MKLLTTIPVGLGARSYEIRIGRGWVEELGEAVAERLPGHRPIIVTNPAIGDLWGPPLMRSLEAAGLRPELLSIPEGEGAKHLGTVSAIYDFLLEHRYERRTAVVALGGGVVGDVAGFAAATFLRGVALVQVPTSLLAMVDSSVGGKTGVNHPLGKNLIGAFKQPALVGVDLDFLSTLPAPEMRAGMAEVVKYGMIADPALFDFIEANAAAALAAEGEVMARLVARSCEIKAEVVEEDEEEHGRRAILNFGHTFAHAAEALSNYGSIRHGEAVAAGMMAACKLGEIAEHFPAESTARLARVLESLGLPVRLPRFEPGEYLRAMGSDKKVRGGRMRFVVPKRIGEVALRDDIDEGAVIRALSETIS